MAFTKRSFDNAAMSSAADQRCAASARSFQGYNANTADMIDTILYVVSIFCVCILGMILGLGVSVLVSLVLVRIILVIPQKLNTRHPRTLPC